MKKYRLFYLITWLVMGLFNFVSAIYANEGKIIFVFFFVLTFWVGSEAYKKFYLSRNHLIRKARIDY